MAKPIWVNQQRNWVDIQLADMTGADFKKQIEAITSISEPKGLFSIANLGLTSARKEVLRKLPKLKTSVVDAKMLCKSVINERWFKAREFEAKMATEDPKSVLNYFEYEQDAQGRYLDAAGNITRIPSEYVLIWIKRWMFDAPKIDPKAFDEWDPGSPFDKLKDFEINDTNPDGTIKKDTHGNPIKILKDGIETKLAKQVADTQTKQAKMYAFEAQAKWEVQLREFYEKENEILWWLTGYSDHQKIIQEQKDKKAENDWLIDQSKAIHEKWKIKSDLKNRQSNIASKYDDYKDSLQDQLDTLMEIVKDKWRDSDLRNSVDKLNEKLSSVMDNIHNEENTIQSQINEVSKEIVDMQNSQSIAQKKSVSLGEIIQGLEDDLKYHKEPDEQRDYLKKHIDNDIIQKINTDAGISDKKLKIIQRKNEIEKKLETKTKKYAYDSSIENRDIITTQTIEKRKREIQQDIEDNKTALDKNEKSLIAAIEKRKKEIRKEMSDQRKLIKEEEKKRDIAIDKRKEEIDKFYAASKLRVKIDYNKDPEIIRFTQVAQNIILPIQSQIDSLWFFLKDDNINTDPNIITIRDDITDLNKEIVDHQFLLKDDNIKIDPEIIKLKTDQINHEESLVSEIDDLKLLLKGDNIDTDPEIMRLNSEIDLQKTVIETTANSIITDWTNESQVKSVSITNWYTWARGYISHPNTLDDIVESNKKKIRSFTKKENKYEVQSKDLQWEYEAARTKEQLIRDRYQKSFDKHYGGKDKEKVKINDENLMAVLEELRKFKWKYAWLAEIVPDTVDIPNWYEYHQTKAEMSWCGWVLDHAIDEAKRDLGLDAIPMAIGNALRGLI